MAFLTDAIAEIRRATDEPSTDAKYSDAVVVGYISRAFSHVWNEMNRISKHPVVVRVDIAVQANVDTYILPPTMTRIIDLQYINSAGGVEGRYEPSSHVNPTWPGIVYEGNTLFFQETPTVGFTLRILYVPSGFVHLHTGTAGTITNSTANNNCTVVLAAAPSAGTLDRRPNAYAGCILRVLTSATAGAVDIETVQDRLIRAYDAETGTVTVAPAFATGLVPATGTYEIVPLLSDDVMLPVAWNVARSIVGIEGDRSRYATVDMEVQRAMRDAQLRETHFDLIRGSFFGIATVRTPRVLRSNLGRLDHGLMR